MLQIAPHEHYRPRTSLGYPNSCPGPIERNARGNPSRARFETQFRVRDFGFEIDGLAEFERELIRARTDEGRKRAQARGVRFGRKLKLTQHQIAEALQRREAGEALVEIGRSYNVSHSTISRL